MRLRIFAVAGVVALVTGAIASVAAASSGSMTAACAGGSVKWSPTRLWPPNHKMQTVTIGFTDKDNDNDPVGLHVNSIASSEAGHEKGSTANNEPDFTGSGNTAMGMDSTHVPDVSLTIQLRSERNADDRAGRTYTIEVSCLREEGAGTATLHVLVPHDQGHK